MAAAGDIDMSHDFFFLPVTKLATATITKGQIISLQDGRPWQANDLGPFGVANQGVASGADMKGKILIDGVIWIAAGAQVYQFGAVVPSEVDEASPATVLALGTGSSGGTGMTGSILPGGMLLGTALDAAASDDVLFRVKLSL